MTKQCNIIADLLPLYHDDACSEDSRQLVEDHLSQCEQCRKLADQIDRELFSPPGKEDLKLLKGLKKEIRRGKKKLFLQGIAAAFAFMLLLFAGYCVWWYAHSYSYYAAFLGENKAIAAQTRHGNLNVYTWRDDSYRYEVAIPTLTRTDGYVIMEQLDNTDTEVEENGNVRVTCDGVPVPESELHYLAVSIVRGEKQKYEFTVNINDSQNARFFVVDRDLKLLDYNRTAELETVLAELEACEDTVRRLVDDAVAAWPFVG